MMKFFPVKYPLYGSSMVVHKQCTTNAALCHTKNYYVHYKKETQKGGMNNTPLHQRNTKGKEANITITH